MLAVDQDTVPIEGDALVGEHPAPGLHVPGVPGHDVLAQLAVVDVALQPPDGEIGIDFHLTDLHHDPLPIMGTPDQALSSPVFCFGSGFR
jgi:hypothetical protein